MAKRSQTPRVEVDFNSRLEQQKIAKAQHPLSKRKVVWTRASVDDDTSDWYMSLTSDLFGWTKQLVTDAELTLLLLQGYRVKYFDPLEKFYNDCRTVAKQYNSFNRRGKSKFDNQAGSVINYVLKDDE